MSGLRPIATSALLALAGHATLLWLASTEPTRTHGRSGEVGRPVVASFRLDDIRHSAGEPAHEPLSSEDHAQALADEPVEPGVAEPLRAVEAGAAADPSPPRFAEAQPAVGIPDAPMPDGGVQLRAFVRVDAQGRPEAIAMASWPADAPPAFAEHVKAALNRVAFETSDNANGHCLQIDFVPGQDAPQWSWRPDGTRHSQRCLTGRGPAAFALPTP